MASFLDGLMGALKGVGSEIGSDIGKVGSSLMGAINPGSAGPGAVAAAPAGGGLMAAGQAAAVPLAPVQQGGKPPGFFQRINTVDPKTGMSTVDKWDRFGARLGDIYDDGGGSSRTAAVDSRVKGRLAEQQQRDLASQIDAMTDDPKLRFVLKSNPEAATKALASHYEAANVGAGDSRVFGDPADGGHTYMAPKYGVEDGQAYRFGQGGFDWGPQRDATHAEVETGRHNRAGETQANRVFSLDDWYKHQEAARQWAIHQARLKAGGYGTPGVGGVGAGGRPLGAELPEGY